MEYIQGLTAQTQIFLYSLGFGFLLGILYDVFRTLRTVISNSRGFVLFMDLLYFAVCAFLIFCFNMVVAGGQIRIYIALGELLGWLIYYFSFGAIAIKACNAVSAFVKRFFGIIFKPVKMIIRKIGQKTRRFANFNKKIIRKNDKKAKYILQKYKGIVYNLIGYTENIVLKNRRNR
ncbi:MAG: spore cortex biosynthesis protein YabQ [Clostridia bacterium]|nr:spore cortex biosynthesis protein YabQ [Clostridia bacterium]